MVSETPTVRHFLACSEVVVEAGGRNVSLRNLIHAVVRLPGEPFPCVCEPMALYALLTNGRGEHAFAVELAFLDQGVERTIFRSSTRRLDLGQDPTVVHGLPIPLKNVTFNEPGQYTFYLFCDDRRIAEEQLVVR
jgi:hypothetical protein